MNAQGDASVCFMKEASVELAIQLLDKSQIRPEYEAPHLVHGITRHTTGH